MIVKCRDAFVATVQTSGLLFQYPNSTSPLFTNHLHCHRKLCGCKGIDHKKYSGGIRVVYNMIRKPQHFCIAFVFLCLSSWRCRFVESLVPSDSSFAASAFPWLRLNPQPVITSKNVDSLPTSATTTIRIQKTVESDLTDIASFLASASQMQSTRSSDNSWMNKIDLLFAKSDIEALIRRRWRILDKGHAAFTRVKKQLQPTAINGNLPSMDQLIKHFWSMNDDLRQDVQMAATETGEDTIWNHHQPMIISPTSVQWFNHLQMSATASVRSCASLEFKDSDDSMPKKGFNFQSFLNSEDAKAERNSADTRVVGFCEIAMLANPVCKIPSPANDCVISITDSQDHIRYYSPAIANLAIATDMRRQGIASKLLQSAERYVTAYWGNASTLGLYVSSSNLPAIALYEKCGYIKIIETSASSGQRVAPTVDSDDKMWYMSKSLRRRLQA